MAETDRLESLERSLAKVQAESKSGGLFANVDDVAWLIARVRELEADNNDISEAAAKWHMELANLRAENEAFRRYHK